MCFLYLVLQIRTIAIIAEGIPEALTRKLIKTADKKGVTIIGPATVRNPLWRFLPTLLHTCFQINFPYGGKIYIRIYFKFLFVIYYKAQSRSQFEGRYEASNSIAAFRL